jgi:hypothetical protein
MGGNGVDNCFESAVDSTSNLDPDRTRATIGVGRPQHGQSGGHSVAPGGGDAGRDPVCLRKRPLQEQR